LPNVAETNKFAGGNTVFRILFILKLVNVNCAKTELKMISSVDLGRIGKLEGCSVLVNSFFN
jgi:hypothetical protein